MGLDLTPLFSAYQQATQPDRAPAQTDYHAVADQSARSAAAK